MFFYFAYGLGIQSTLPLPEFVDADTGSDVIVRFENDSLAPFTHTEASGVLQFHKVAPEETIFSFNHAAVFQIYKGREIVVFSSSDANVRFIQLCIAGAAMAILLQQRKLLVLHANVVEVNKGAVAFLGSSGLGKSSMAAALHACGHGIIADDVTAVDFDSGSASVFPAFPQLKISLEVAIALGYDIDSLLSLHPCVNKRAYCSNHGLPQTPLPLRCLYVLSEGDSMAIEPLQPQEALIELVRHSYGVLSLQQARNSSWHFRQCAILINSVPIYRLKRPDCLSLLPDLARLVERHLAH